MKYYFVHENIFVVDNISSSVQIGKVVYKISIFDLEFWYVLDIYVNNKQGGNYGKLENFIIKNTI